MALLPAIPALAGQCSSVGATSTAVSPALLPTERTGLLDEVGAKAGGARAVKRVSVVSATNPTWTQVGTATAACAGVLVPEVSVGMGGPLSAS
jgi:hypothetical protein